MSRRKAAQQRKVSPDPIYNSELVARFINRLMVDGKRGKAEKIFYRSLEVIKSKINRDGLDVFKEAYENVKPKIEVKSRRVGGSTYQVPIEVYPIRQRSLAIRWIVTYSRQRNERSMENKLAGEFIDAANNTGASIKKREDVFKMAESNKAFAHYRW